MVNLQTNALVHTAYMNAWVHTNATLLCPHIHLYIT
jgi:hypothetical protein